MTLTDADIEARDEADWREFQEAKKAQRRKRAEKTMDKPRMQMVDPGGRRRP